MAFTATWNAAFEASPADGDNISEGAGKIRNLKRDMRETLEVDHYFDKAGTQADHGEHLKLTLHAPISTPSNVANKGFLYGKDISSKIELHYLDEDDNEVQLTNAGALNETVSVPAASEMLFYADAAPSGWTLITTVNDKLLFITKGSTAGGQTGGGAHSTGTWTQPDHTLTTAEIPAHAHTVDWKSEGDNTGGEGHAEAGGTPISGIANNTGGGGAHNHGTAWRPASACFILCSKD